MQQTVNGTATNYLWDEESAYGNVILETDASNNIQASYVLGDGQLISQKRGANTSYFLPDAQGSTRALTNSSGAIIDMYLLQLQRS